MPLRAFLIVADLIPKQFGGGMRFLCELGRRAAAQRIRMGMLLAGEPIPVVADAFRAAGICWWSLPDWKAPDGQPRHREFVRGFRRFIRQEKWDVVAFEHCSPLSVVQACALARALDGQRFGSVWHQHSEIKPPKGFKQYLSRLRLLVPFMDAFVAVSDVGANAFRQRNIAADKIRTVYNGVRIPQDPPRGWLRQELGLAESTPLLTTVAALRPVKGVDILLQAAKQVLQQFPQWHLVVAGGGDMFAELQGLARQLGIEPNVHFLGFCNNVPDILADSTLYVQPSRSEAMPVAILEAMACSLAVVATDVGGVRDEVVHGQTGLLVPPQDPGALAAALVRLMGDKQLSDECGRQGHLRVQRKFSLEQQVEGYLSVYREVCQ